MVDRRECVQSMRKWCLCQPLTRHLKRLSSRVFNVFCSGHVPFSSVLLCLPLFLLFPESLPLGLIVHLLCSSHLLLLAQLEKPCEDLFLNLAYFVVSGKQGSTGMSKAVNHLGIGYSSSTGGNSDRQTIFMDN